MSVVGSLGVGVGATALYDVLATAIRSLRERHGWETDVVDFCLRHDLELDRHEASWLVAWIREADLPRLLDVDGGHGEFLVESLNRDVFRTWDPALASRVADPTAWAAQNSVRAERLAALIWGAIGEVLNISERHAVQAAVSARKSSSNTESVLAELGWLRDAAVLQREILEGVPLERAHLRLTPGIEASPYQLLWPRSGIVPYDDRGGWLPDLAAWCGSPERISVRIVAGVGGMGKTRLALELCRARAREGWLAGLLRPTTADGLVGLAAQGVPRLVVIDYAELQPQLVREVLAQMVARLPSRSSRVRILLLVRRQGGRRDPRRWFTGSSDRVSQLIDAASVLALSRSGMDAEPAEAVAFSPAKRERLYASAVGAFARQLGRPAPAGTPDLSAEQYGSPLFVLIAALLAVLDDSGADGATSADELLDRILEREQRTHWHDSPEPNETLQRRQVVVSTLFGADDEEECVAHLRALADYCGTTDGTSAALWLHGLYEGPRWANPLEPDLMGEHLVAEQLTAGVLDHLASLPPNASSVRAFSVLARIADSGGPTRSLISDMVTTNLGAFLDEASRATPPTSPQSLLLPSVASVVESLDLAPDSFTPPMHRRGPVGSGVLATVLADQALKHARQANDVDGSTAATASLARALLRAGDWHEDAGDLPHAYELTAEAVDLLGSSVEPDSPSHVRALTKLASRGRRTGHHTRALEAIEEAVAIQRRRSTTGAADERDELAVALNNLAAAQADRGFISQAVATAGEVVDIRRSLLTSTLGDPELRLARALNNLAIRQRLVRRQDAALRALDEAVAIARPRAAEDGTLADELAAMFTNIGLTLAEKRDDRLLPEAIDAMQQAIELRRDLADQSAGRFEPQLADSLDNLAVLHRRKALSQDADPEGASQSGLALRAEARNLGLVAARQAVDEAIEIGTRLQQIDLRSHSPALARHLLSKALVDVAEGDIEGAHDAIVRSLALRRPLAADQPQVYEPDLATALVNLHSILAKLDPPDEQGSLEAIAEALEIRRRRFRQDPTAFRATLARTLDAYALAVERQDDPDHDEARAARLEAEEVRDDPAPEAH